MVKLLGIKRILVIVMLIALNVGLACAVYLYIVPEHANKDRQLRGLKSQISTLQGDIERMQIEFDQLEAQQHRFDGLRDKGFIGDQNRRQAELLFEKIGREAGVVSSVATIQSGVVEENEEAAKAEHKILKSPITVRIDAMDDVDVYRYLFLVQKFFPGHITLEKIEIKREGEVTGVILRSIASGTSPKLVSAEMQLTWRTMISPSQVIGGQEVVPQ